MSEPQPGILLDVPAACRYLFLRPSPGADLRASLAHLAARTIDDSLVVGIGQSTLAALGASVDGLIIHPALSGPGVTMPSTPAGLWLWLRGDDRGSLLHRSRELLASLPGFELDELIEGFRHLDSRDLSGFVDGTENPKGDDAVAAAFTPDHASYVVVQRWVHDFARLDAMTQLQRDHVFGRSQADDVELDDAPPSAHVKRTAQESFEPEAFVLRRSMPWSEPDRAGLVFVAFGRSFDAYLAQLRRMLGHDDGITDALFRFTRPVSSSMYWCPPLSGGRLDLSRIGIEVR